MKVAELSETATDFMESEELTLEKLLDLVQSNRLIPIAEQELTSDYWYIFMGKEESDNYYVLFLNEKYFTKQDVIDMARNVHLTADAFN